ncbi:MAG: N-acetylmuramoyl-L-alanine amidase [Verrucomicrobium sp.]|nr:N-acetylmuramoyl-L-alanine amidase [Verrucomicrobium sp.]
MRRFLWLILLLCYTAPLQAAHAPSPASQTVHIVHRGETLYSIAKRYGVPVQTLRKANHLSSNRLRVGARLVIPGRHASAAPLPPPKVYPPLASSTPAPPPVAAAAPAPPLEMRDSPSAPHLLFVTGKTKQLIDSAAVRRGRWRYIVFHHSGTPNGNAKIFDYFHKNVRGMPNGLAYHFVIGNGNGSGDGEIEVGNRWLKQLQGGHLHSDALNEIAIGVCFVGDFNRNRPTKKQIAAAIELTSYLREKCGPPTLVFKAHREINPRPTECPGKLFPVAAFHRLFDNEQ